MSRGHRLSRGAATLLMVSLVACGASTGGGDGTASSSTSTDAPTTTTATTTSTNAAHVIEVTVAGGRPDGGARRKHVTLGELVRLVVSSDVQDEVHVHTYELRADVGAGATVEIEFVADIPGVIEVELEDRHTRILTLEVQP